MSESVAAAAALWQVCCSGRSSSDAAVTEPSRAPRGNKLVKQGCLGERGISSGVQGCIHNKRAGTSPVNAAVRYTLVERQVHFQSSD